VPYTHANRSWRVLRRAHSSNFEFEFEVLRGTLPPMAVHSPWLCTGKGSAHLVFVRDAFCLIATFKLVPFACQSSLTATGRIYATLLGEATRKRFAGLLCLRGTPLSNEMFSGICLHWRTPPCAPSPREICDSCRTVCTACLSELQCRQFGAWLPSCWAVKDLLSTMPNISHGCPRRERFRF
jgi:hypothetical protein